MARIKYGISNVYYAPVTAESLGVLSYGTPVALQGAVSLTMNANGDEIQEYADNITWFAQTVNQGYTGTLEVEDIPDSFRTTILGEVASADGGIWESSDAQMKEFALLFQFEVAGDNSVTGKRGCFLRCTASRPAVSGSTKQNTISPNHDTLNLVAMPRVADHYVKASCESTATAYSSWFSAVPVKS